MSNSRAEFEAWATSDDGPLYISEIGRNHVGDYVCLDAAIAWDAWQASRAQPERKLTDAEIRELAHKHLNGTGDHCIINFARALLAAQPAAATVPEWISVEERLPEVGELFLTVDEDSDLELLTLGGIKRHFGCITHWMPLPPPPAAQAQDDGEKQ